MAPPTPTSAHPTTGIALIGSGIFAKTAHLPAIQAASPTITLRAIYSRTLASAAALSGGMAQKMDWYSDETTEQGNGYDNLLQREDIAGLVVALPITRQADFVRKALAAGKHVLSEKPIAKDVTTAKELLQWYTTLDVPNKGTWAVAENYRFMDSFDYAATELKKLGRLLQFRLTVSSMVEPGGKYYETAWRKTPEYQGGFLLDGGIHPIAALRLVLGTDEEIVRVAAFTEQLQPHLPPIDTVDATLKTKSGVTGTVSMSYGTTFKGTTYAFACEDGTLTVTRSRVVIKKDDAEEVVKEFPFEGNGVNQEVLAWSESISSGAPLDSRQSPEEALKDLELLEAMLQSGERGGVPIELAHEPVEEPVARQPADLVAQAIRDAGLSGN